MQISTLPPDAELLLDGEPISNPFDGELVRDDSTHKLLAKRDGFDDSIRQMVLKSGQRIFIQMTAKGQLAPPPPAQPEPKAAPVPRTSSPKPAPAPTVAPAPAPVANPPPVPTPTPAPAPSPAPAPAPAVDNGLKKIF